MAVRIVDTSDPAETESLGAELAGGLRDGDVVLVRGELGSGKTTLVRGAARALGVTDRVTSPSFSIGHRYRAGDRLTVSHLDLYRLAGLEQEDPELLADYLGAGRIAFVEWPPDAAARARRRAPARLADPSRRGSPAHRGGGGMIVLGFDTATQATVVGLRLADGSTLQASDDPAPEAHPGHATRLLAMSAELLAQAGIRWGALERIAVGIGPGRFTGLRVGIATARGLAQSLDVELTGVSSLQALALAAAAREPGRAILAVIDARRDEAFAAAYSQSSVEIRARRSRSGEPLARRDSELPRALSAAQLQSIVAELEQRGAPPGERWLAVGDGAVRFALQLRQAGVEVAAESSGLHAIDPLAICELGASAPSARRRRRSFPTIGARPTRRWRASARWHSGALLRERALVVAAARQRGRPFGAHPTAGVPGSARGARIERRVFPTPWSLAMFVLELSKQTGICLARQRRRRRH